MKIQRCSKVPFQLLVAELQRKEGTEHLVKKVQRAAFKIGVKGAPTKVKRFYNRCMSRYPGQSIYCASIAWSVFCATNPRTSHCKNFV